MVEEEIRAVRRSGEPGAKPRTASTGLLSCAGPVKLGEPPPARTAPANAADCGATQIVSADPPAGQVAKAARIPSKSCGKE